MARNAMPLARIQDAERRRSVPGPPDPRPPRLCAITLFLLIWFLVTLDHEDIEAIAERAAHRVVQLLDRPARGAYQLLDPKELARELSVSVDYVYAHAVDLGAMRLGDGPKARLRFDLQTAQRAMRSRKQPPQGHRREG
jgi:hypothetical protein